jgi:hypothetical protein
MTSPLTGRGAVLSKADLLDSARKKEATYERQDEEPGTQKVRVWGDTVVVTAVLWIKSVQGPISKQLQRVCHDTLDFVSVPGFPSAILVFGLTHSRRIVVQRLPWLMMFSFRENLLWASRPCRTASRGLHSLFR